MEWVEPYSITVLMMGLTGMLLFVQLLIADVSGIKAGHPPGYPIAADHNDFLFRASRAIANANESVAIFLLFAVFSMLSAADADWVNRGAVVYWIGRIAHMCCYYSNRKLLRSASFAVSLLGLATLGIAGTVAWCT